MGHTLDVPVPSITNLVYHQDHVKYLVLSITAFCKLFVLKIKYRN